MASIADLLAGQGGPGWGLQSFNAKLTLWLERELLIALQCIAEGGGSASGENQQRVNTIPDRGEGMEVQCSDSCREREAEEWCKRGAGSESRPRYSTPPPSATRYLCPSLPSSPVSFMAGFKLVAKYNLNW